MGIYEQLKSVLNYCVAEREVSQQQALSIVLKEFQHLCDELDLDFPSAIDASAVIYEEEVFPWQYCQHDDAYTLENGALFCPRCNSVVN